MKYKYLLSITFLLAFLPSYSQWQYDPRINTPVCTATLIQQKPKMVSDGSGNFIIVWQDQRNTAANADIRIQKISAAGIPMWTPADGVVISGGNGADAPAIVSDGSGGAVVTWQAAGDIFAQRVNSSGAIMWAPVTGITVCNATGAQANSQIARNALGNFVIVWDDLRNGNSDIFSSGFDLNGALISSWISTPNGKSECNNISDQVLPKIEAIPASNNFVIAWEDKRNFANGDICAQIVSSTGVDIGVANGMMITNDTYVQTSIKLTTIGANSYLTWQDQSNGFNNIYLQKINGSLVVQYAPSTGKPLYANPAAQTNASIINDGTNLYIAWDDNRSGNQDIFIQKVDEATSNFLWAAGGIAVTAVAGTQNLPFICLNGSVIDVCWRDFRAGQDVYGQAIDVSTGAAKWTINGVPVATAPGNQAPAAIVADPAGFVTVFTDARSGSNDIYVNKVDLQGNLPVFTIAPISGFAGTNVTLSGTDLLGTGSVDSVLFGATSAVGYTVASSTTINAVVPASLTPGLYSVNVINKTGQNIGVVNYTVNPIQVNASISTAGPYCAGQTVLIDITPVGGTFNSGNNYTVELSDNTGAFTGGQVTLGIPVPGTGIATLSATIPTAALTGTYKLRVKTTSPIFTSSPSAASYAITATPSTPTVISPIDSCGSTSVKVTLGAGTSYSIYSASTGGTALASGTSPLLLSPASSATYYASSVSGTCESLRASVQVNINTVPTASPILPQSLASGQTTAISLSGTPGATYNWTTSLVSGTVTGQSNSSSLTSIAQTLYGNGVIRYTITPVLAPCSGTPITVDVTVTASIYYSVATGNWETSGTWSVIGVGGASCGCLPTNGSEVVIGSTHVVTKSDASAYSIDSITIHKNATLNVSTFGAALTVNILSDQGLLGNGTLSTDAATLPAITNNKFLNNVGTGMSTIVFSGSTSYNIPAIPNVQNLVVMHSGAVNSTKTLIANISVGGNLIVGAGSTANNVTFTLGAFTANRTALGGIIDLGNSTTLTIGGTNSFPLNYATHTIFDNATFHSSVVFNGTIQNIPTDNYSAITTNGGVKTLTGNIVIKSTVTVLGGTLDLSTFTADRATLGGSINLSTAGILKIGGTNTMPANYITYNFPTGSTIYYYGSTQVVKGGITYGNLIIQNSGIKTVIGGNINISASDLTLNTGATLDLGTFTANRSVLGGTLTVSPLCSLMIGGTNTYPTNYSTNTLGSTSVVDYYGTAQNVTGLTYGNLVLDGSGTKTLQAAATVAGGLTINTSSVVFDLNTSTGTTPLSVGGNIILGGTLKFNSSPAKTVSVTGNVNGPGTIDMTGAAHVLNISGPTNAAGSLLTTAGSASKVSYARAVGAQQIITSNNYEILDITGGTDKTLVGSVTVNNKINFSGNGRLILGANNIVLGASAAVSGGPFNTNKTIVLNGSVTGGAVVQQGNVSADFQKTYPLTTSTGYNELTFTTVSPVSASSQMVIKPYDTTGVNLAYVNLKLTPSFTSTSAAFDLLTSMNGAPTNVTKNNLPVINAVKNVSTDYGITTASSMQDLAGTWRFTSAEIIFYSRASTAWELNTTWSNIAFGGIAAPTAPSAGSVVYIGNSDSVYFTPSTPVSINIDSLRIDKNAKLDVGPFGANLTINQVFKSNGVGGNGKLKITAPTGNATIPTITTPDFLTTSGTGDGTVEFYGGTNYITPVNLTACRNLLVTNSGVVIQNGNIAVGGDFIIKSGVYDMKDKTSDRLSAGGTFTLAGNSVLRLSGPTNFPNQYGTYALNSISTVEYYGGAQTVRGLGVIYGKLKIVNPGLKTIGAATSTLDSLVIANNATTSLGVIGSFSVGGNADIQGVLLYGGTVAKIFTIAGNLTADSIDMSPSNNNQMILKGTINTINLLSQANGNVVEYTSNNPQNIAPNILYKNLKVTGTGLKSLTGLVGVEQALNMNGAVIELGNNDLQLSITTTITNGPALSGTNMIRTSGTGVLSKTYSAPGSFTFPVGTLPADYSPSTINVTTLSASGKINVRVVNGVDPSILNPSVSLKRYWVVTSGGTISSIAANMNFTYLSPADIQGVEANYIGTYYTGTLPWVNGVSVTSPSFTLSRTGANINGEYTANQQGLPVITGLTPSSACIGDSIDISGTGFSGVTAINISTGFSIKSDLLIRAKVAAGASTGFVTATSVGGTGSSNPLVLTVKTIPAQPVFSASVTSVCKAQSYNYAVTNDVNVTTYNWSYIVGTGATFSGTTNSILYTYSLVATSGYVKVSGTNACGIGQADSIQVTVNSIPATPGPFTTSFAIVCQGDTKSYIVNNDPTASTYNWTYGGSGVTFSTSTNANSVAFSLTAISDTIKVSASNVCGTSLKYAFPVTVNSLPLQPSAITSSSPGSVCQGQTGVSYSVVYDPTVTYNWSYLTGTGVNITPTGNMASVDFTSSATSGKVNVTAQNGCGISAGSALAVIVNSIPVVPVFTGVNPASVCQGQTGVSYGVINDPLVTAYNWSYMTGTGATITPSSNVASFDFSNTATSGSVSVTAQNSCGTSAAATSSVTVTVPPSQPSTIISSAATVCPGQNNVTYSVTNDPLATSGYSWSYSGTGVSVIGSTNSVIVNFSNAATPGALSVKALNGCVSPAQNISVVVSTPLPPALTKTTLFLCNNTPVTLGAGTYSKYAWKLISGGNLNILPADTVQNFTAYVPGAYFVTVQSGICFVNSDTLIVNYLNAPPSVSSSTVSVIETKLTGSLSSGFINYQWYANTPTGFKKIQGANAQSYSAYYDGEYIFAVTSNDCYLYSTPYNLTGSAGGSLLRQGFLTGDSTIVITPPDLSNKIKVYPNPATSEINVNFIADSYDEVIVGLYNNLGNLLMEKRISDKVFIEMTFNELDIPSGLYHVQVRTKDKNYSNPILISK